MKKIVCGLGIMFNGTFLYLAACFAGIMNMPNVNEWYSSTGRNWQSVITAA